MSNSKRFDKINCYESIHHTGQKISGAGLMKTRLSQTETVDNLEMFNMGMKPVEDPNPTILERLRNFSKHNVTSDILIGNTPPKLKKIQRRIIRMQQSRVKNQ